MRRLSFVLVVVMAAVATPVAAQIAWEGPSLVGPATPTGMAIFLTEPSPGSGLGALVAVRHRQGGMDVGYRVGVGEGASGDVAIAAGVDVSGTLASGIENADIDVIWWGGAGAGIGDEIMLSVPLGLAVGWTGAGDDVVFSPYAGGHVSLDVATGAGDAIDLSGAVDVGLDMTLVSGWVVRAGASFGSRDALAIGLRIPSGGSRARN